MKKTKLQKGITLIALLITVILLLILAAVTIGSVKENDIIGYAQNAATDYEKKQNEEQGKISEYKEGIKDVLGANYVTGKVTVDVIAKKNSTINGNVPSSDNPIIPAGFKAINVTTPGHESSWDAEGGPEVNEGLVIEDEDGNQFVWIPVSNINDMVMCQVHGGAGTLDEKTLQCLECDASTKLAGKLYATKLGPSFNALLEGQEYNSTEMREVDIVTVTKNVQTNEEEDGADNDLNMLALAGLTKDLTADNQVNGEDFKQQMQEEFNSMVKSVSKYGGFYVGRYETSIKEDRPQSKASVNPEQPIMTVTNYNWYELYSLNKKYTTSSVKSSMIWGSQYDVMMKWMEKKGVNVNGEIGEDRNKSRTCGTASEDVLKNIYDLYGNAYEWTLEAYDTKYRIIRGGESALSTTPSNRVFSIPTTYFINNGSRITLYIM